MRTSGAGIALIKRFEGFARLPYRCPAGVPTIGYGHVMHAGSPQHVDEALAGQLLQGDLLAAESAIGRLIVRPLKQWQFDALASFTYNLGAGALQRSTLRRVLNRYADEEAAGQFLRWVHAGGRRLPGLVRRRMAEARIFQGL